MTKLYRLLDADRHEYLSSVPGELGGHRRNRIMPAAYPPRKTAHI